MEIPALFIKRHLTTGHILLDFFYTILISILIAAFLSIVLGVLLSVAGLSSDTKKEQ